MTCWRDITYCMSPNCTNECGRKMDSDLKEHLRFDKVSRISFAYFCGEPNTEKDNDNNMATTHNNEP